MIPYEWWSWILMLVGVTGIFLTGRRIKWGWLISVLAECLWILYAIATGQYGFIVAAIAYGVIDLINFRRWSQVAP